MNRPAPAPAAARRPRRADVRDLLLEAALALFAERGYEQTSLDQVAAAAGFTKGAVYSNFGSKDELFLTLMDQQIDKRVGQVRDALQLPHDAARTGQLLGDQITAALDEDAEWQLLFLDYVLRAARDPAVRERFVEHRRRVRALVAAAVSELVGPLPSTPGGLDAEAVASAVLALSYGLGVERLTDPTAVPDDLFGRLLQALQPEGPAAR